MSTCGLINLFLSICLQTFSALMFQVKKHVTGFYLFVIHSDNFSAGKFRLIYIYIIHIYIYIQRERERILIYLNSFYFLCFPQVFVPVILSSFVFFNLDYNLSYSIFPFTCIKVDYFLSLDS